jgi:hypothetical protein
MTQSSSDLTGLLKRVEGAEGPDRELDRRLWKITGQGTIRLVTGLGMNGRTPGRQTAFGPDGLVSTVPRYTASLDQALALCERVLPGWCRSVVDLTPELCEGYVWERFSTGNIQGKAKTPALALLAAILRALILEGGEDRSSVAQSGSAPHGAPSGSEPSGLWRRRPVVVDAIQFTGTNCIECVRFMGGPWRNLELHDTDRPYIETLEGDLVASPGDWIIRGTQGEHYPCEPDIFAATYEPADAPAHEPSAAEIYECGRQTGLMVARLVVAEAIREAHPIAQAEADAALAEHTSPGEAVAEPSATEDCIACGKAFAVGDAWLPDASGGAIHFGCCGPERESYTNAEGDPLGPDDPIPEPLIWEADPPIEVDCLQYAHDLAVHLAETHYPNGPKFQPFDTMSGLLSQIDNMICGLQRKPCEHVRHDGVPNCVNCGAPGEAAGPAIANLHRLDETENPPSLSVGEESVRQVARKLASALTDIAVLSPPHERIEKPRKHLDQIWEIASRALGDAS